MKSFVILLLCLLLSVGIAISKTENNNFIPGTVVYGYGFGIDEANRLAKDGVFIGKDSKGNYLDLAFGNILLIPDKDILVSTHAANIHITAGAAVFIMESGPGLVVYDLAQPQSKEVTVVVGKYKIAMKPGKMLTLTGENATDHEKMAARCDSIPSSNMQRLDLRNTAVTAFVADFSLTSALFP